MTKKIFFRRGAEDPVVLVCAPAVPAERQAFTDNLEGHCDECGRRIMFRPQFADIKRKLCINCAPDEIVMDDGGHA